MSWQLLAIFVGAVLGFGAGAAALSTAAVALARRRLILVEVSGVSMYPTYRNGDRLLVGRRRRPRRGAVAVVAMPDPDDGWLPGARARIRGGGESPNQTPSTAPSTSKSPPPTLDPGRLVKRVVARSGDPVPERLLAVVGAAHGDVVPSGMLLLLGDHRFSLDSKQHGYCPEDAVVGVVITRLGRRQP